MGLSDYFTFSVDVAFDAGPFSTSPTWTDVTDDVLAGEGVTFSRGTRTVGSRVGPGLADLTMRNWSEGSKVAGRWTPGVAASPWHPLDLKRRLRIKAIPSSVGVRTNLATYPSAESGTTGWTSALINATISQSSAWSASGTYSYALTSVASGTMAATNNADRIEVTPGVTYAFSVRFRAATVSRNVYIQCEWRNAGNSVISTSAGSAVADSTSADVVASVVAAAPALAATGLVYVVVNSTGAAGEVHRFDGVLVEESSTVGTYFDGASPGCEWTGTAHASTSRTVTYPLWAGHITDHTPGWVGAGKATCGLSCSDLLAALARVDALPDLMVGEQLTESPSYLWPLDDSEDSTTAGNRTGAAAAILTRTAVGSPTNAALDFGGASTPTGQPSATFTPDSLTAGYSLNGDVAGLGATNGLVIECAVKPEGSTAGVQPLILLLDDGTGAWLAVCREVGYGISIRQGTRLAGWTGTPTAYMDATLGLWATVGVRLYSGGGTIEITGGGPGAGSIFGGGTIGGPGSGFSPTVVYVGGVAGNIVATNGATFEGSLANVALYASDWANATPTRLTTHLGSFSPALADVRFEGLCRSTGLPTALYSADASTQQVLPAPTAGRQLTAALNEVADSDRGSINVDAEGALRFSGRDTRHGVATSVTLDARTDILNSLDGLAYNDEDLVNDVTVTRDGGATVRHVNQASADEYGSLTDTADVIVNSDDDAQALAEWLANVHSQPAIKAPTLRVSMLNIASRSSSTAAALCALDLGQRITVTNLPAGLPATTLDLFVEGISDDIGADDWVRTITTSNITRGGAVAVLDDDTYGLLDDTFILA